MLDFSTDEDTAKKTAPNTAESACVSHFQNAVELLDSGKNNKLTFYLSDNELALLFEVQDKHSISRNQAFKLALAALKDRLATTE